MGQQPTRRNVIKQLVIGGSAAVASPPVSFACNTTPEVMGTKKGNVNHSVCRWTYSDVSLDKLCNTVRKMGFTAIDLVGSKEWKVLKSQGVNSSMCNRSEISLTEGFNTKQYHAPLLNRYREGIELVAKAGYKNLICFSGNRNRMDDETGLQNCAEGLKPRMSLAESKGIVLQMELFNSKIDHKDYMCDNTCCGVELCKQIGSPNFKLLYDIYHMQINEGDGIRTINDHHTYFGHYHTAGVPGRHVIDNTPELYYRAIMRAIVASGFKGYIVQEFIPTGKPLLLKLRL